jgi:hypothetical protein
MRGKIIKAEVMIVHSIMIIVRSIPCNTYQINKKKIVFLAIISRAQSTANLIEAIKVNL